MPANGETAVIETPVNIPTAVSVRLRPVQYDLVTKKVPMRFGGFQLLRSVLLYRLNIQYPSLSKIK
jgi:hypothetical protein